MSKFKAGDKVECVNSYYNLTVGKCYDIVSVSECGLYYRVINDSGNRAGGYNPATFKLLAPIIANGVDAEGHPLNFTNTMMRPFMRVIRREGTVGIAISSPQDGLVIVGQFKNGCSWTSGQDYLNPLEGYADVMEVYEAPSNPGHLINKELKGDLIWKRVEKTAEQLVQESATAARGALIEDAEKALKSAQDKLATLKGL